ncbi:hypothetical protein ACHQM5_029444 [Ranunculus cassubicifolius]
MDSSLSKELNLQSLIAKLESKDWMRVFGSINTTKRIAMSHSTLLLPILIVGKRIWYDWMKVVLSRNEFCGKSPPCHLVILIEMSMKENTLFNHGGSPLFLVIRFKNGLGVFCFGPCTSQLRY